MWRNDRHTWGGITKALHWSVALLLVVQYTLGSIAAELPLGMDKLVLLTRHKSLGLLILLLVIVRVAWRLINTTPQLPARTPLWQHRLAQLIQFMLYVCLVTLPISGWIMSSARNFPVSVFGLFQLPDLVEPNERTFELARALHESLAWALVILVTIHVLGALQHHFVRQDDVLRRMLPFVRRKKT